MDNAKEIVIKALHQIAKVYGKDPEVAHQEADDALLSYIDDPDISNAFASIRKWYA